MDNDKGKIILKRSALPGVDMSVVDLELVSTVKIRVTILKKVMYKIRRQTFIGTRDQLDDMDVIQLGSLRLKYRVIKLIKLDDYGGYIYRIKRIDGEPTIGIDIDNASKLGQKINIVNRPTFDDLFNYACSLREEVLKEEEDCYTGEVCDTKSPIIPIIPIDPVVPACNCSWYSGALNNTNTNSISYIDCNGVQATYNYPGIFGFQPFSFYGQAGQTLDAPSTKGFYWVENLNCEELECLQYNLSIEDTGAKGFYTWVDTNGDPQIVNYLAGDLPITLLISAITNTIITESNVGTVTEVGPCPPPITCIGYTICMSNGGNGEQRVRYFDCDGAEQEITLVPKQPNTFYYFCGLPEQTLERDFVSLPSDTFEVNQVDCTELPPEPTGSCAAP